MSPNPDNTPPREDPTGAGAGMGRRPVVGVMGSGQDPHLELTRPLGRLLAELGVHLLTGGGGGVMEAVSRAFYETPRRTGLVVGVLPSSPEAPGTPPPGYPNPWVEIAIATHLPWSGERGMEEGSRNHLNVLSADAVVVLPGGAGTASELALALRYGRPFIVFANESGAAPGTDPGHRRARSLEEVAYFLGKTLGPRLRPGA